MKHPKERKTYLVTGGAGFIGSTLVRELIRRMSDLRVVVLDNLVTGNKANLPEDERVEFIEGSVEDRPLVRQLVDRADVVFHLAARNIIASTKNPLSDFETNIGGTLNVLLAAWERGGIKVVYASSASVYGNPRYLPISEDDPLTTLSPYSASKLAGENYCVAFYESFDVPTVCLRYSNVYGPNEHCGVVKRFLQSVAAGEAPQIHGDGAQTRDFTYVADIVDATIKAAHTERGDGAVFNIATAVETQVSALAQSVIRLFDTSLEPRHIERRDIDNIRRRALNIERARRVLRWVPETTLEQGLRFTYDWHAGR